MRPREGAAPAPSLRGGGFTRTAAPATPPARTPPRPRNCARAHATARAAQVERQEVDSGSVEEQLGIVLFVLKAVHNIYIYIYIYI